VNLVRPNDEVKRRLELYRAVVRWNEQIDPIRFVEQGIEPQAEPASLQTI
jgi:hypothetical protein